MSALLAIATVFASALAAWLLSSAAARRREVAIGAFPFRWISAAGALGAVAAILMPPNPMSTALLGIVTVAAVVDARSGFIFDALSRSASGAFLIAATPMGLLDSALCGACLAGGLLALVYLASRFRGFGAGDVKLGTAIGAALGVLSGVSAIAAAFIIGAGFAVILVLLRRATRTSRLPFAPFLALGVATAIVR